MKSTRLSTLFYFGFMAMELSYLYILTSLLDGPIYTLILMLLLYPFALLSKLALPRLVSLHQLRLTLEITLITLVILLVTGERLINSSATEQASALDIILQIGLCGFIWLMGYTAPYKQVNYTTVSFRLQIGFIAVMVSQVAGSSLPVFLFFGMAPVALFLARWSSSLSRGANALRTPNPRHLLLAVISVMLSGTALIILFSPALARDIIGDIGGEISNWVEAPQESADNPSTSPKHELFGCSCNRQTQTEEISPSEPSPSIPSASGDTTWIDYLIISIIFFAIFLALVALMAFTLRLRRRKTRRKAHRMESMPFQIRKIPLSMLRSLTSLFPQLVRKLWLWLTTLFQRWKKPPAPSEETLISIRALYRNLLRWAARQGVARLPSQTPMEHLLLLEQRFPQQQADLKQVVDMYLLGRYSQKPVSQEEFDRARKAWQRAVAYYTPLRGQDLITLTKTTK